ncbi:glucose-1-phosphate thymidylyltransferase [Rubricella aquisinus]|uniref:Glucose-1-phosphate thymidylyltransferase n=1 Tax=Rubricella aquisinus TaxID=2028108 RepID=A0A840WWS0_9RHOB|nr:glucose-1-phosphate thymidylyltransferase RfbA [Rubricella aquisinus]MBB5515630.1 glucose-1-phosphate thymidylyltransferase [Rubricella aquisinus]
MKGIILAGGTGSRLWPMTQAISKQIMPVYDKPMIYYPLSVLMLADIREVLIITTPHDRPAFEALLGDGAGWGLRLTYAEQPDPGGLAQAYTIGAAFVGEEPSCLILGDNLFVGQGLSEMLARARARVETEGGATVFGYSVADPDRYGIVTLDASGRATTLEEKPTSPRSNMAVTGLYFYDGTAAARAATLTPSPRGELEITDLNRSYLADGALHVEQMGRGYAWLDTGTPDSLLEAATFIGTLERRQGVKIACPEEIAYRKGLIDAAGLRAAIAKLAGSPYAAYLEGLLPD